jgi:hypothetical protein
MASGGNYLYEILGVKSEATADEIKKAYRKKALKCHPDKFPGDEAKAAEFHQLKRAYEELSNPARRAIYDEHGVTADAMAEEGMNTTRPPRAPVKLTPEEYKTGVTKEINVRRVNFSIIIKPKSPLEYLIPQGKLPKELQEYPGVIVMISVIGEVPPKAGDFVKVFLHRSTLNTSVRQGQETGQIIQVKGFVVNVEKIPIYHLLLDQQSIEKIAKYSRNFIIPIKVRVENIVNLVKLEPEEITGFKDSLSGVKFNAYSEITNKKLHSKTFNQTLVKTFRENEKNIKVTSADGYDTFDLTIDGTPFFNINDGSLVVEFINAIEQVNRGAVEPETVAMETGAAAMGAAAAEPAAMGAAAAEPAAMGEAEAREDERRRRVAAEEEAARVAAEEEARVEAEAEEAARVEAEARVAAAEAARVEAAEAAARVAAEEGEAEREAAAKTIQSRSRGNRARKIASNLGDLKAAAEDLEEAAAEAARAYRDAPRSGGGRKRRSKTKTKKKSKRKKSKKRRTRRRRR